ncbi:MAG: hypothetical protein F4Y42_04720 [Caldilineaceae bacterium SB0664_bin_27]|uniref:Uncharacterized protein n=1 Tax=Caldilineaceae bacterium SB0664_bin_27 TaxID=2605260 RepID=A0A6B0YQ58_9CHLR|nr:hypothetical protein [Caldilineaceae bacterium SB0664_bin_27]
MAESLQAESSPESVTFRGKPKSMVSAVALLIAGTLTFTLGINRIYFVEAIAWTFLIWGALLLYGHIIDLGTVYEVTEEGLAIKSPLRFWALSRNWDWGHFTRMDVIVKRREASEADVEMQVHYTPEDSTVLFREDLPFIPELAGEIASRAGLKPERRQAMQDFDSIPQDDKATYTWN